MNPANRLPLELAAPATGAVQRLRDVNRAAGELRRGTPVLLLGDVPLVLLAAETAGAAGLATLHALSAAAPQLLLAPARAAAVLGRPLAAGEVVALRTAPALLSPEILLGLADPTVEQMLPEPPQRADDSPALGHACLALAKLARLLPAVLAAPARPDALARAAHEGLIAVSADSVLSYPVESALALRRVAAVAVPLDGAPDARIVAFRAPDAGIEHMAILVGRPEDAAARGGVSSATTRPRSVTSTVSPAAAARICRLSSFFRALMPTLRMVDNVATRGYFVNPALTLTARADEVIE